MINDRNTDFVKLGLPKGRMQEGVSKLLQDANIRLITSARQYRPSISLPNFEVKVLKPQNIAEMLHFGSRDVGFTGADWVLELEANVIELLDTKLDPVSLVAGIPENFLVNGQLPKRPLIIASEFERLTKQWIEKKSLEATFVRSYGATEVFPPEDADCIVDISATGSTLRANNLAIADTLLESSTRLFANPLALDNPQKREIIERLVLLLKSVLDARDRVIVEVNVSPEDLAAVIKVLPSMRHPTISPLHNGNGQDSGFAVKAAVKRKELALVIPAIKACGGTDIVVSSISQLVP